MKGKDALREVMGMRRMTQTALSLALGYPNQSGVAQKFQGKQDLRVDILAKFLEPLDCELIIRDKKHPERVWVIGNDEEDKKTGSDYLDSLLN